MGACPSCGEGPVVRGICRACHAKIGEPAPQGEHEEAPGDPRGQDKPRTHAEERAEWYRAAGMAVPESKNRDQMEAEDAGPRGRAVQPVHEVGAHGEPPKDKNRKVRLLLIGTVVLVGGMVASGSWLFKQMSAAPPPEQVLQRISVSDGKLVALDLGFSAAVPPDLVGVEPSKLPERARSVVLIPRGGKGMVVLAQDGSFTGLVAGAPAPPVRQGASPLELLPPGLADAMRPIRDDTLIPALFKEHEAYSFRLGARDVHGVAHVARTADGRLFVVHGWGPAVLTAKTQARIAGLLSGLHIQAPASTAPAPAAPEPAAPEPAAPP